MRTLRLHPTARSPLWWHAAKAGKLPVPDNHQLKTSGFKNVGKPLTRLDTPSKVNGSAIYGLDFRIPGMKYAVLARCAIVGGKVSAVDDAVAKGSPGVSF